VVGKFSSDEQATKFDNLAWKMGLPAAAILQDDTSPDGITVYSNVRDSKPFSSVYRSEIIA
jgi:hypothetical protein